jgi:membrane protease YdiL (CAAX protease family)
VEFIFYLIALVIITAPTMFWARWSKLDLGFRAPAFRTAEPWVLLYMLWGTAEWAVGLFMPFEGDSEWLARMEQNSLVENLVLSVVVTPVVEELLFRGAMFAALLRRWGIWPAALVPSLIWGLIHVQYEWWVVVSIAGSGILLAMVRWRSGSLYLPIVLHAAWNLLVTFYNEWMFAGAA